MIWRTLIAYNKHLISSLSTMKYDYGVSAERKCVNSQLVNLSTRQLVNLST